MKEIFTTITLQDGSKCDILALTPWRIWKATYKQQLNPQIEYDITPFILEQILIVDGKKVDMKFIGNMDCSDYFEIAEILSIFMTKLEI